MKYSNEGTYERSERGATVSTAITFLLIGLGAGALIGMLYAPKAGKQLRKDMRRRYDDARDTIEDWKEQARDIAESAFERGSEMAEELRDRVSPVSKTVRKG